jgi:hypothetical protein
MTTRAPSPAWLAALLALGMDATFTERGAAGASRPVPT